MNRGIRSFSGMGAYHASANEENQDAVFTGSSRRYAVISLADGVSECCAAGTGARIAGQAVADLFLRTGDHFLEFEDRMIAEMAISHVVYELRTQACGEQRNLEDYSSTVAAVLYDKRKGRLLYLNLGDSMILAAGGGRCKVLAMPGDSRQGCCVTTTEGSPVMMQARVIDVGDLDSVVICSDGAWKRMYAGNRLKQNVSEMLLNSEYDRLKKYLEEQGAIDDHSFISMDLKEDVRRMSA